MVKCVLPKDNTRVRFPLPAPASTSSACLKDLFADVAQLVEQCFRKAEVVGSIPTIGSTRFAFRILKARSWSSTNHNFYFSKSSVPVRLRAHSREASEAEGPC
jgi:hypothetical protein